MLLRRFLADESGGPAAEMALMLPILMALMFGGMEGGYYFWSEHRVIKAVRDGARFAGRQSFDQYNCTPGSGVPVVSATKIAIKNLTRTGTLDGSGAPVASLWQDGDTSVSVAPCNTATATGLFVAQTTTGAIRVTVSADVAYNSLFSNLGMTTSTLRLRASQEAVVMGL